MVIEYAGSVIRATLTDKRENYYEGKVIPSKRFHVFVAKFALLSSLKSQFVDHVLLVDP